MLGTTKRWPIVFLLAASIVTADASGASSARLGPDGYGAARWGMTVSPVEQRLGVTFDCSGGLSPGTCICPPANPPLPVTLVFGVNGTLTAAFTNDRSVRSDREIHVGSRRAAVSRAYPSARLEVNMPLTSGLSTFYLYRRSHHALVFVLTGPRVSSIIAFSKDRGLDGELCA